MHTMIEELFTYYLHNQDELVKKYNGKYIVITKDGVVSSWDKDADTQAYYDAKSKYGLGNFIMQMCTPGKEAYTFHNYYISDIKNL